MATSTTPTFDRLILDLSYKLRDIVNDPKTDGKIFHYEAKARYLRRAFLRTKRKIGQIAPSLYANYFPDAYKYIVLKLGLTGTNITYTLDESMAGLFDTAEPSKPTPVALTGLQIPLNDIFKTGEDPEFIFHVNEIYAKVHIKEDSYEYKNISYADQEKFFKILFNEASAYYKAGTDAKNIWFTIMDNKILIAGGSLKATKLKLFVPNYVPVFVSGGPKDIIINNEIEDLLVFETALEAVLDKGDSQSFGKAKFYSSFITNELALVKYREESQMLKDKLTSNK